MPLSGRYELGGVDVAVWRIAETEEELLSMLPAGHVAALQAMKSQKRRLEWLAVRALLATVLGPGEEIVYDMAGKPFLSSGRCNIGISHTNGYAVLAWSGKPFGVDAELAERNILSLSGRLLGENETASLPAERLNEALLAKWCACEALYKLVGNLGATYKDNVVIGNVPLSGKGVFALSLSGVQSLYGSDFEVNYLRTGSLLLFVCTPDVPLR